MTHQTNYSRRRFLQTSAAGAALAALPGLSAATGGSLLRKATPGFNADVEIEFSAQTSQVRVFAGGPATRVQTYSASLLKGPASTLRTLPDNYLGPILSLQQGQKVRIFFDNRLQEP